MPNLIEQFLEVRQFSSRICQQLEIEDYVVQTSFDVSPAKWHLAHTSWFFEEFILKKYISNYTSFHAKYGFLFNSYYNSIGDRVVKDLRGILSRPTVTEIMKYREYINQKITELYTSELQNSDEAKALLTIGVNHEQQHQELMIYDIKHIFFTNPLKPTYQKKSNITWQKISAEMIEFDGGLIEFGSLGKSFSFDNEYPRHKVFLNPFQIQNRLVTNGDYLQFIEDDGYSRHEFWLADGWDKKNSEHWLTPLYWENNASEWVEWQLSGYEKLDLNKPVSHISFYEAYAYAKWAGKRLPTEYEFEMTAEMQMSDSDGYFLDRYFSGKEYISNREKKVHQLHGFNWQWTSSAYTPYPGYKQSSGAIGEYNGKFMSGQMVLRGGSCATMQNHYRHTYRNFFQPEKRWLFSGIRLAEDGK